MFKVGDLVTCIDSNPYDYSVTIPGVALLVKHIYGQYIVVLVKDKNSSYDRNEFEVSRDSFKRIQVKSNRHLPDWMMKSNRSS